MIIEIPDENSIVKWKNDDKDEWKVAEISDLIKAYEKPQGDLISRRVVKGMISDKSIPIKFEEEKIGEWQYSLGMILSDIYNAIDNAPTVEITDYDTGYQDGLEDGLNDIRPQGEWIGDTDYESYQGNYEAYKCSNCGYGLHWRDYYAQKYNYCPNCGAKMGGGAE